MLNSLGRSVSDLEKTQTGLLDSNQALSAELEPLQRKAMEWDWFFENSLDMLCIAGVDGWLKRVNSAFERTLGYTKAELLAEPYYHFVHPEDLEKTHELAAKLEEGEDCLRFENRYRHKNGEWRWLAWTCPAPGTEKGTDYIFAIARDVTEQKISEGEILYRARHDALSGLINRAAFDVQLTLALGRTERNPSNQVVLLMLDLDNFKAVNDTLGHQAGDAVLKEVANRILRYCRKGNIAARLGGDEFALILEGPSPLHPEVVALKLIESLRQPFPLGDDRSAQIGCSIGISTFPDSAQDEPSLIKQADESMYSVKRNGKNLFQIYGAKLSA